MRPPTALNADADRYSVRVHQLVMAAAFVVPALLFAGAAYQNHADVLREGHESIDRTAAIMQEHARKVFETAELAVGVVDERINGEAWSEIASPATSRFLHRLKAPMDQIVSIWIADADGVMRAGSQPWPAGSGIATRPFFEAQKVKDRGTYIGEAFTGAATKTASFAVIRRRTAPDGRFDGTIHVAVSPAYFAYFYAEAAPGFHHTALLLRADGAVLAREPAIPGAPNRLSATSPLMRRIADWTPGGGAIQRLRLDGSDSDTAIRKVGASPVFVVFSVPRQVMLAPFDANLRVFGVVAATAALTLLVVAFMALRRAESEQVALVLLRREVRQRQAAELQLRHAQRMDAVGQLTGGVAHDFNNLLTAILGNLELIKRSAGSSEGQARIGRLTTNAIKAVHRGASLTKSLLAFSRKQPLQPRAIDANALLGDFVDFVRQATGVAITVMLDQAPALPACIADPAELEAALLNLAINARDAMPDGGTLRIATSAVHLGSDTLAGNPEAEPGAYIAIAVADTGSGMTPDVAAKAFEPFFTTKPIGQGTGLGLSQVFGFVRQLGGHVTIGSAEGHGSLITLYLPVAMGGDLAP